MMLTTRSTEGERMDTDCVDYADYERCLRDLGRVNMVTLTHRPMLAWLKRQVAGRSAFTLLDVACGHGDALRRIRTWSLHQGVAATLSGIDLNPWAIQAARAATPHQANISFHVADVFSFAPAPPPDLIISSQFTHHLTDEDIVRFIRWMETHATLGWFIGDLHRHWFPYYGFGLLALAAGWHRFVRQDGRVSIARGFVRADWERLLAQSGLFGGAATVSWHMPFRLCVARTCKPR